MPATFDWDDTEEIGIQLADKLPETDPLSVRFTDLHKWITEPGRFHRRSETIERRQAGSHPDGVAGGA